MKNGSDSCLTLCNPMDYTVRGILQARILERVGSLSLLQAIFPTQESNRGRLHCRRILYQVSYQGKLWESMTGQHGWAKHSKLGGLTMACSLVLSSASLHLQRWGCSLPSDVERAPLITRCYDLLHGGRKGSESPSSTFYDLLQGRKRRSESPSSVSQFSNSFRLEYSTRWGAIFGRSMLLTCPLYPVPCLLGLGTCLGPASVYSRELNLLPSLVFLGIFRHFLVPEGPLLVPLTRRMCFSP